MLYELRIYECVPGRLPDPRSLCRFDTIYAEAVGEARRSTQAGFWTGLVIGRSSQTYAGTTS